jgi:hypothetical protein
MTQKLKWSSWRLGFRWILVVVEAAWGGAVVEGGAEPRSDVLMTVKYGVPRA